MVSSSVEELQPPLRAGLDAGLEKDDLRAVGLASGSSWR